jgi:hypothetical protein
MLRKDFIRDRDGVGEVGGKTEVSCRVLQFSPFIHSTNIYGVPPKYWELCKVLEDLRGVVQSVIPAF